jgi:anti-sigma-K factor RskA
MDHTYDDEDLTPEERHALASLGSDRSYFRGLEDRTVSALRRDGLLRQRAPVWVVATRWTAAAAALVLAFIGGAEFQKRQTSEQPSVVIPASTGAEENQAVAVREYHQGHYNFLKSLQLQAQGHLTNLHTHQKIMLVNWSGHCSPRCWPR